MLHLDDWIIETGNGTKPFSISSSTTYRSMCSYTDSMLLAKFDKRFTLEIWVSLNLVHRWLDFGVCQAVPSKKDIIVAAHR